MAIDKPRILCLFSAPLVAPNGESLDALDFQAERDAIVRELTAVNRQIELRIAFATVDELARGISDGFNILHFSGHGHPDFLLFEDGKGGSHPVNGEYLKKLIGAGGPFELAIVSACHSERIAEKFVQAGVRHAAAIRCDFPVLDRAAIAFAGQFYRNLLRGDTIQKSFDMAKLLVEGNPELSKLKPYLELLAQEKGEKFIAEERKFVLLPEDDPSFHQSALVSPTLPQGMPPADEPQPADTNIPVRPESFTGRSRDLYSLINEVLASRLLTVTGAGGIGKTVLATEVARWFRSRGYFRDGIYSVNLREAETTGGIIGMLGAALKVPLTEMKHVVEYLRDRQCLLLLDNAEDALYKDEDSVRHLLDNILRFAPHVRCLVTSQREVGGNLYEPERVYRVRSMQQQYAALLFLVTAKRPMSEQEWKSDTFSELLRQTGGHPLSIVLLARQLVPGASLEDLLLRIRTQKAKAITVKGITDRDPEHGEDLVAALSSAYDHLSTEARTVFAILSMLPAGVQDFTLKEICGDKGWEHAQELHDASLAEMSGPRRMDLLAPVRLFGLERLSDGVKNEYGPKIVEVMSAYAGQFYAGHGAEDAKRWRLFFAMEEPNFRYAIGLPSVSTAAEKTPSALGGLAAYLLSLYLLNHRLDEAAEVAQPVIPRLKDLGDKLGQANTLQALGDLAMRRDELDEAGKRYDEALKIFRQVDEKLGQANTLKALGDLAIRRAELDQAGKRYDEALVIYRQIDDKLGQANTLKALSDLAMRRAELDQAGERYDEALKIYRQIDEKLGQANTLEALGYLAMRRAELDEAGKRYDEALKIFRQVDEKVGQANTLKALGDLAMRRVELDEARERYDEALGIYRQIDEKLGQANVLTRSGQWLALTDQLDHADRELEEALRLYTEIEDLEGEAEVCIGRVLVLLKRAADARAKDELDRCLSIREKAHGHGEAAQWLLFYADHLKSKGLPEGAKICLEYAEQFAAKARDTRLHDQVKHRQRELDGQQ